MGRNVIASPVLSRITHARHTSSDSQKPAITEPSQGPPATWFQAISQHTAHCIRHPADRTAMVDVDSSAPPLQASVQEANTINQQQVLAQQQMISQQQTQEQGGPSGLTMGARAM